MTFNMKKSFNSALAAILISTATFATVSTADAGERHYRNHGQRMNHGAAVGLGVALFATAIAVQHANSRNRTHSRRCEQAEEWRELARYADRHHSRREAKRRWAKYRQAKRDCKRWARN